MNRSSTDGVFIDVSHVRGRMENGSILIERLFLFSNELSVLSPLKLCLTVLEFLLRRTNILSESFMSLTPRRAI
jgi:hypothetical protein